MKILYIHQYFKIPEEGGAIRSYYLAKALLEAGHEVEIITTHNAATSYTKVLEGLTVHYISNYYSNELSYRKRIWSFLKFIWKAYRKALSVKEVDWVYATSTPLSVGIIALLLKYLHRKKYIFEVRDLWPLVPIDMGIITQPWLIKILYGLEKRIYDRAEKIVALSPPMEDDIVKKTTTQVYCLPNIADISFWQKKEACGEKSAPRIIAYIGTIGIANQVAQLVEVAQYFQERGANDFHFWVIGAGKEKADLITLAENYQLHNVKFFSPVDKFQLRKMMACIDAMYISYAPYVSLQASSPNKFFDSLASGKMLIVNIEGWLKEVVVQHQCGVYADNAAMLYNQMMALQEEDWQAYGQSALKVARQYFAKDHITTQFVKLFM